MILMKVNDFIKLRERDWQRLEQLIGSRKGRAPLDAQQVHELGKLYRAVASDLALARRDYPNQRVSLFLNQLLTRTHSYIYQQDASDFRAFLRYFTERIPQTFRQTQMFTLVAFLLFIIPAFVGYRLAFVNPDVAEPLGLSEARRILADQSTWTDIPIEERPYTSAYIMGNNIRVAILAFGGGVVLGLFTVYVLSANGLFIGAIMGLAAHYGMGGELFAFVVGHGVIELSVIFIAGGTGLQLGWALLNPGPYSRKDTLALAARRAVILVVAAIPFLVIAGLIEGFVSPSALPPPVKVVIGVGSGIVMYSYLLLVGRRLESGNRN